ncbi:VWA domain-containing protein [Lacinutrix undariae]
MTTPTFLYIGIAGIIALLLALFQYIYKSKKKKTVYKILAVLRFVTLFSVLLLLINPKFDKIVIFNEKPNLVLAVDNSESITFLNQNESALKLISELQTNDTLQSHFNIEEFSFGKNMLQSSNFTFTEKQSNMAVAFKRLSEIYNNTVAPTIFITDGNQTYGNDYQFAYNTYKQPIYPIILGDTTQFTDLKIQQLNVNKYAYLKNKFPVEIIAIYKGDKAITTQFKITSGNRVMHTQNISFTKTKSSQVITVTLPANRGGVNSYKAELVPLQNEKNTINNSKNFAVEVIDQKTKIALISDIIHPDLGALKKAIESNEQRSVNIVTSQEFLANSADYQLVIAYQPGSKYKQVSQEIARLKLNTFLITGTKTNWSLLNSIQDNYTQTITRQTEGFQPVLNPNYTTFIIEDLNFEDFPPLQTDFGDLKFKIPFETMLSKSVNGTQLDEPLLVTFESGTKREAILNGEGIWTWRAQSFLDEKSFDSFDNFIGKIVQYLSTNQKRTRLNVDYESFYNGNDNLKITAQYFNKNYEFDANANLNISLKHKITNKITTYPFVLKNSNYQVDLSGLTPGEYTFTTTVANQNTSKSGELTILEYNVEQQFLNANVTKLQQLASNSGGQAFFIKNTSDLVRLISTDKRFSIVQKSTKNEVPLIDWKYLLGLIILSLVAEWFTRKYNGLI